MRILWLDINSSYSHSSVALPAIHAQISEMENWEWEVVRATINDNPGNIAAKVVECQPDLIASTFWLFTHNMQIEVLSRVTQVLKDVKIVCGGPEFLGNNEDFLRKNNFVTAIVRGEGEIALPKLLSAINQPEQWEEIAGLCWISYKDQKYHDNGIARVENFSSLKYPEESKFFNWDKPFVQLETTRGCFNTCAFCVSGGEKPVRYQSIEQVKSRLENIYKHGIKDIRVLDRTFNYDLDRAGQMLDIFAQYEGKMRFHLEIHPSLISEGLKEKLSYLPKGLLHLEAGIQSLDSKVLEECGRRGSLESSLEGLKFLCSLKNVQTHADLIAGLPRYSLETLCKDIIKLIEIGVDELQVESLKVLPGTQMRLSAEKKGLYYSPLPPYEILQTPDISVSELRTAMQISRMLDLYYNSDCWQKICRKLILEKSDFLLSFTEYLKEKMVLDSAVSMERRGILLYEYCKIACPEFLCNVSIAWIEAGFSLKKEVAGKVIKIKNIETFISTDSKNICIKYGEMLSSHRYFLFNCKELNILFAYDSINHQAAPAFMAVITD